MPFRRTSPYPCRHCPTSATKKCTRSSKPVQCASIRRPAPKHKTLAPVVGFHNRQIDRRLGDGQVHKSLWAAWQTEHSFRASTEEEILCSSSVTQHRYCSSSATLQAHDGASRRSWPWAPLSVAHSWTRARFRTLLPAFRIPWPTSCPSRLTIGPGRHPTCWVLVGFLHHRQSLLGDG